MILAIKFVTEESISSWLCTKEDNAFAQTHSLQLIMLIAPIVKQNVMEIAMNFVEEYNLIMFIKQKSQKFQLNTEDAGINQIIVLFTLTHSEMLEISQFARNCVKT